MNPLEGDFHRLHTGAEIIGTGTAMGRTISDPPGVSREDL